MSGYLKGHKKEEALDLIRKYIVYRLQNDEILERLNEKGYSISERTLRRYKQEVKERTGNTLAEIYKNEVVDNVFEDIFSMQEIQEQAWKEHDKGKTANERLKALILIRTTISDKVKLYGNIPLKFRVWKSGIPQTNNIIDSTQGDQETLTN